MARIKIEDLKVGAQELSAKEMGQVVGGSYTTRRREYRNVLTGYRYVNTGGHGRGRWGFGGASHRVPVYQRQHRDITTTFGDWAKG